MVVRAWAPKRKLKEVRQISMCSRNGPGARLFFSFAQTHTHTGAHTKTDESARAVVSPV